MSIGQEFRKHPENAAAVINGLVVAFGPALLLLAAMLLHDDTSATSITVRPPGWSSVASFISGFVMVVSFMVPAAVVAGWRTRVHAERWLRVREAGWQGVGEAGAAGFTIALLVLIRGILTRPLEAPPYILVYGGLALAVGLATGIVLHAVALLVLKWFTRR